MTPRALAFALAIGIGAEDSSSDATRTTHAAVSAQESAPATHLDVTATHRGSQRLATWNDPCVIAV